MDAEALVLAVLKAIPDHEIRGRKRLQKLAYFAVNSGADAQTTFSLRDFGPFSPQVAAATDMLSLVGDLSEEDTQVGRAQRYVRVYKLSDPESVDDRLPAQTKTALQKLNEYTTVELEIASTLLFFMLGGQILDQAIESTKALKPAKAVPLILAKAKRALAEVGLDEGRRTN